MRNESAEMDVGLGNSLTNVREFEKRERWKVWLPLLEFSVQVRRVPGFIRGSRLKSAAGTRARDEPGHRAKVLFLVPFA